MLTLLGGKPVYGDGDFKDLAPPLPPAMPDWSPVRTFGGYQKRSADVAAPQVRLRGRLRMQHRLRRAWPCPCLGMNVPTNDTSFWGALGCSCWAV